MKRFHKKPRRIAGTEAWLLVILGILLGTVFTFGMQHWEASVSKEEAVYTQAAFSSCKVLYGRRHSISGMQLLFTDHAPLTIDGACCSQAVLDSMEQIASGTVLCMYVHPNSSAVLEIRDGNDLILRFEDAVEKLSYEVTAFFYLGIFLYLMAAYGLYKIVRKEIR